jgi:hypothetical protein
MTCVYKRRLTVTKKYSLAICYAKGNQDKSLLNLNSDAYTNARLRDTITNYGFKIDTKACVLPVKKSGDCRLSDPLLTIFKPVCIISFSPGQKVSKYNIFQMFKNKRHSPPQSPILTGNIIWYSSTSAAKPTCIYKIIRGRFISSRNFIRRRIWMKTWMHANKALCLFEIFLL